jgi:hypothetical protein
MVPLLRPSNDLFSFPPLYKNGGEGVVTQLRPSTSHILMWGVREQKGHPPLPHDRTSMMMNQQPLVPDPFEEICG